MQGSVAKWNATEAARQAGYAQTDSLYRTASEVLHRPDVRAAINAILELRRQRYSEIIDRAVEELAALAFAKITPDAAEIVNGNLIIKDTSEMDEATQRAIAEISETETASGRSVPKLKMHNKAHALALLLKVTGGIVERHAGPDGKGPIPVKVVTPETVDVIKRKILGIGEEDE
jgi:hypothetical protein